MKFSARQNRTLEEIWVSGHLFFCSTLAHICLHSVNAGLSHRALSLSPNINYGSRLKVLPAAPLQIQQPIPLPASRSAQDSTRIYCCSLHKRHRPSQPPRTPPWRSHPSYTDSSDDKPGDKFFFSSGWKEGWWKKVTLEMAQKPNPLYQAIHPSAEPLNTTWLQHKPVFQKVLSVFIVY